MRRRKLLRISNDPSCFFADYFSYELFTPNQKLWDVTFDYEICALQETIFLDIHEET